MKHAWLAGALGLLLALAWGAPVDSLAVRAPGTWTTTNALWDTGPAGTSGLALKVDTTDPLPPLTNGVYGLMAVTMPAGTQIEDIGPLAYDVHFDTGSCGGGSPRFQLRIDLDGDFTADKNVFVYGGALPNFDNCPQDVWTHEDLTLDSLRFDSTQLGGPFYGSQAQAHALAGPGHQVLGVVLVWDSTWLFGPSTMWFDNVRVNTYLLDEPPAQACVHVLPPGHLQVCPGVEVLT